MGKLLYEKETGEILGACFEVYREMGCGFLEPVYQDCLAIEFDLRHIPASPQDIIKLMYKGQELQQFYRPDFLCFGKVVVEIKAVSDLLKEHESQLLNYLNATGLRVGLLINFGHHPGLQFKRIVL